MLPTRNWTCKLRYHDKLSRRTEIIKLSMLFLINHFLSLLLLVKNAALYILCGCNPEYTPRFSLYLFVKFTQGIGSIADFLCMYVPAYNVG